MRTLFHRMKYIRNKKLYIVLQFIFVILLLATATGKSLDIQGFADVIQTYQFGLPDIIAYAVAVAVILFELGLAISILFNYRQRINAILLTLMHTGYVILAATTLYRGIELKNCGCFGVFLQRSLTIQTVYEDLVLVLVSLLFYFSIDDGKRIDDSKRTAAD